MICLSFLSLWIALLSPLFVSSLSLNSSSDEMEKFINECQVMINTMEHCAEGWVALEQEMIASVDTFADRIIFTQSLIQEETELIIDMAERIVQTEEIMIDLIESCNCTKDQEKSSQQEQIGKSIEIKSDSSPWIGFQLISNSSQVMERCSAMDYAIEVMDQCLKTFEVYNDDFISVLSYMNVAIQDMGDRIVDTECLIVNMSYQIGYMADRIVETEEIMAEMAKSCCRGASHPFELNHPMTPIQKSSLFLKYGDDDEILSHCNFNNTKSKRRNPLDTSSHAKSVITKAVENLHHSLSNGQVGIFRSQSSYRLATFLGNSPSQINQDGPMPCETFWNPFCCAAEVCADMMVEMIQLMASGADWMTEMCISMIDEIGKLADDIVKTEENIVMMGYAIGDMADCIVVFIDQGLEFMTLFCPATKELYSITGKFQIKSQRESDSCSSGENNLQLKNLHLDQAVFTKYSPALAEKWNQRILLTSKLNSWVVSLKNNPFGEFAQMVEVMMQTMAVFMNLMDQQTKLISDMMKSMATLSTEEMKMSAMVVDMGTDVTSLGREVSNQEDLMIQLNDCKK